MSSGSPSPARRPGSLWPSRPYLKTDGERLVLMQVPMNGKYYNITIERFNERGETILVGPETKFSARTILSIQNILQEMLSKSFRNPEDCQVLFSDINGAVCQQMHLGGTNERFDIPQEHDSFKQMEAVHAQFFKQQAVGGTYDDKVTFITPVFVSREELDPKKVEPEEKAAKVKKAKVPKRVREAMPKALSEKGPVGEPDPQVEGAKPAETDVPKTQDEYVENVHEALADASQAYQSTHPLMKGVSYADLENYSNTNAPKELEKVYKIYQSVVKQPDVAVDEEKSEMMKWLKHHYHAAVAAHRNMRQLWEKDQANGDTDKNFDDWCKFYAAKAVALWIKVNYSADELVKKLLEVEPSPLEVQAPSLLSRMGGYLWSKKQPASPSIQAELKPF